MKTLCDEAFYEGVYDPEEAGYVITLARKMLEEFKKGLKYVDVNVLIHVLVKSQKEEYLLKRIEVKKGYNEHAHNIGGRRMTRIQQ